MNLSVEGARLYPGYFSAEVRRALLADVGSVSPSGRAACRRVCPSAEAE